MKREGDKKWQQKLQSTNLATTTNGRKQKIGFILFLAAVLTQIGMIVQLIVILGTSVYTMSVVMFPTQVKFAGHMAENHVDLKWWKTILIMAI